MGGVRNVTEAWKGGKIIDEAVRELKEEEEAEEMKELRKVEKNG